MNLTTLRIYSLLSMLGVVILMLGELQFFSGYSGTNRSISHENITASNAGHISCGISCSVVGIGLMLFILYPLRVALFKTEYSLRQWLLAAFLMYMGCLLIFHVAMGFIGLNEQIALSLDAMQSSAAEQVRVKTKNLFMVIITISTIVAIAVSVLFAVVVLRKKTCLPIWSILFTPALIFLLLREMPKYLFEIPAPYGGYYQMSIGCIGLLLFFGIINRYACVQASSN